MTELGSFFICVIRWNSWNFFACNISETVIKETGVILSMFFLKVWFSMDEGFKNLTS